MIHNIYVLAGVGIAGVLGGWTVKGWQEDAYRFHEEEVRKAAELGAAEAISKITVTNTTIKQQFSKEYHEKPVYRDCVHTDNGMRLINQALIGSLNYKLPTPNPDGRENLWGDLGKADRSSGALSSVPGSGHTNGD